MGLCELSYASGPLGICRVKMKLEWPICNRNLGHLCLYVLRKGLLTQYASPDLAIIQSLSCATEKLKRSVARSHSLVVYPDIDVVPTVMCQWGERGTLSIPAWVWDVVWREKKQSLCVNVYTPTVCTVCPFFCARFSHKTNDLCWSLQEEVATSTNRTHASNLTYYCQHCPTFTDAVAKESSCSESGNDSFVALFTSFLLGCREKTLSPFLQCCFCPKGQWVLTQMCRERGAIN